MLPPFPVTSAVNSITGWKPKTPTEGVWDFSSIFLLGETSPFEWWIWQHIFWRSVYCLPGDSCNLLNMLHEEISSLTDDMLLCRPQTAARWASGDHHSVLDEVSVRALSAQHSSWPLFPRGSLRSMWRQFVEILLHEKKKWGGESNGLRNVELQIGLKGRDCLGVSAFGKARNLTLCEELLNIVWLFFLTWSIIMEVCIRIFTRNAP